jgi:peroxiredoxin
MKVFKTLIGVVAIFATLSFTNLNDNDGYDIGDIATDFSLENIDGTKVSLADYKDAKGFIVIFTCNTCPYAVAYEDRIIELDKKYASQGYPVIAIMPNNVEV